MRRMIMVLTAVAGVTLAAGCSPSPQRVGGDAAPVGGVSPARSVSPSPPVAASTPVVSASSSPSKSVAVSRAASRTPSSPATSAAAPNRITPEGYGALKIGMTRKQAEATGLVRDRSGGDDRCVTYELVSARKTAGLVVSSSVTGIVAIPAPNGVSTPEGIRVGSTLRQVEAAYPDHDSMVAETGTGQMWANQNDGDGYRYNFYIQDGKVDALAAGAEAADCG